VEPLAHEDPLRFFHPVIAANRVGSTPVAVTVAARRYVLFRDGLGRIGALVDRCPHRFAPLSAGRVTGEGRLACPYHGWNFDIRGKGRSPSQPALTKCDARALNVMERDGYVWLGNDDASTDDFPQTAWPGFHFAGAFTVPFAAPLFVVLDNFSEDEHTPWVHTRLGWNESNVDTVEFSAENFDDRTEVHYAARQRPAAIMRPLGLKNGDLFHNDWVTRFDPVRSLYTIYFTRHEDRERRVAVTMRANIFMTPQTDRSTQMHVFVSLRYESPALLAMRAALDPLAVQLARREIEDDARFIPTLANTPATMKGMRLGRFDKPLIHNRKLLAHLYWGREDETVNPLPDTASGGG